MNTYDYYFLGVIGRNGMYTYGDNAATPELARINRGNLHRTAGDRLGVYGVRVLPGMWTDSAGHAHPRRDKAVLVDAEPTPGAWDAL